MQGVEEVQGVGGFGRIQSYLKSALISELPFHWVITAFPGFLLTLFEVEKQSKPSLYLNASISSYGFNFYNTIVGYEIKCIESMNKIKSLSTVFMKYLYTFTKNQ